MIATCTWVLSLFYNPIGLRPENVLVSGEHFCVKRTFLRQVPLESLVGSGASGLHGPLSTSTQ